MPCTEQALREGGLYRLQDVLPEVLAQYGIETPGIDTPPPVLYCDTEPTMSTMPAAAAC